MFYPFTLIEMIFLRVLRLLLNKSINFVTASNVENIICRPATKHNIRDSISISVLVTKLYEIFQPHPLK